MDHPLHGVDSSSNQPDFAVPTYMCQIINEDGSEGPIFEIEQSMTDPPLTRHPESGLPVRRIYQPPNVFSKYTLPGAAPS